MRTTTVALVCCVLVLGGCKKDKEEPKAPADDMGAMASDDMKVEPKPEMTPDEKGPEVPAAPKLPKLTDKMPSSVSAQRPEAIKDPLPKADYKDIKAARDAGPKAIGKTILFRGYVTTLKAGDSSMGQCDGKDTMQAFEGRFDAAMRPFMRAIPTSRLVDKCPLIFAKITGQHNFFKYPQGTITQIFELQPDPAPTDLPKGVDYLSMDDALMDGKAAVGKVMDVPVYIGHVDEKDGKASFALYTTGCAPHGGWNATLYVQKTPVNAFLLDDIKKAGTDHCTRIRVKLTQEPSHAYGNRFEAEIIGYGDTFKTPSPAPVP